MESPKLVCPLCPTKTFSNAPGLKLHNKHMHGGAQILPNIEGAYKCDQCPRVFHYPTSLEDHVDAEHKGLKKYACPQCDGAFGYGIQLNQHVNLRHTKPKMTAKAKVGGSSGQNKASESSGKSDKFAVKGEQGQNSNDNPGQGQPVANKCGPQTTPSGVVKTGSGVRDGLLAETNKRWNVLDNAPHKQRKMTPDGKNISKINDFFKNVASREVGLNCRDVGSNCNKRKLLACQPKQQSIQKKNETEYNDEIMYVGEIPSFTNNSKRRDLQKRSIGGARPGPLRSKTTGSSRQNVPPASQGIFINGSFASPRINVKSEPLEEENANFKSKVDASNSKVAPGKSNDIAQSKNKNTRLNESRVKAVDIANGFGSRVTPKQEPVEHNSALDANGTVKQAGHIFLLSVAELNRAMDQDSRSRSLLEKRESELREGLEVLGVDREQADNNLERIRWMRKEQHVESISDSEYDALERAELSRLTELVQREDQAKRELAVIAFDKRDLELNLKRLGLAKKKREEEEGRRS